MSIYTYDTRNFLSKLTFSRIWNAAKVLTSYYLTQFVKGTFHWGSPITVSIEPTTACNLRCPECPSGLRSFTRNTGRLNTDFFRSTIDQINNTLMYLIFYFQGEPYLNPKFLEMVAYAHSKKIYTITSTNGHFLSKEQSKKTVESGLDRLIISIDGTTQDVYSAYRKEGKLDVVIEGAKNMVESKRALKSSTPHIVFQFLVVKPNEHQIEEVKKLAKEIGVDEVKFKTAQVYDYVNGNPLIPTLERYSRYAKQKDGTYKVKNSLANRCWKLWHSCVITWDGIMVPCCFDKDASHPMGDLKSDSFLEVWNGTEAMNFREKITLGRDKIDICNNCTEGCKVWA